MRRRSLTTTGTPKTGTLGAAVMVALACQRVPEAMPESHDMGETTEGVDGSSFGGEGRPDDGLVRPCAPDVSGSCPLGEKCTVVVEDNQQNLFRCVEDDGALGRFEACVPAPLSGQDTCRHGLACLGIGKDANTGVCLPLCQDASDCDRGTCARHPHLGAPYCADECSPFASECDPPLECRVGPDRFACQLPGESDDGAALDPCVITGSVGDFGCAGGLICLQGSVVPGCGSQACCTPVCDADEPTAACPAASRCQPIFTDPAPGFSSFGACVIPQ